MFKFIIQYFKKFFNNKPDIEMGVNKVGFDYKPSLFNNPINSTRNYSRSVNKNNQSPINDSVSVIINYI